MITYKLEKWADCKDEIRELSVEHWEEIALNKDKIPLDPDWDRYEAMGESGVMQFVTCREGQELVGYSFWLISNHLHYKSTKWAYNDVIFLKNKYRKTGAGLDLIRNSEIFMRQLGCKKIQWHVKVTNNWTHILERLGYAKEDIVMGKVV